MTGAAVLELAGVTHRYGGRAALHDVSFSVAPAGFAVLLGPNGAGKTTLFLLAACLLAVQQGSIRVFGTALDAAPAATLARMGFVFQEPTLDLDLTVRENLLYHAALHGLPRREALARADAELAGLGLGEAGGRRVRNLSGGERRRVEIVRALLHRPALLLLDEATSGLDVAGRRALLARARALTAAGACAVLWTTHLLDEVAENDAVIVLHRGRVVACGRPAQINGEAGCASLAESFARLTGLDAGPA